ncbi:MAG: hypothetical protein MUE54_09755 [Anaerolineae bacterium]|jgi:hypothetical protein|nr:hypothetical protein [Anaerolineae bacterium]
MWQTFLIWRVLNSPLPVFNPFRKLLKLKLPEYAKSPKLPEGRLARILALIPSELTGCIMGLGTIILVLWVSLLCIVFITPIVFVVFDAIPLLVFLICVSFGMYLSVKITRKLGKIRNTGMYDLIGVSGYGDQHASWLIGRTIYKDMGWLKDTRIMMSNSMVILVVFFGLMGMLGIISAVSTPTAAEINFFFLRTLSGLVYFTFAVYLNFVQALVIGYLMALWAITMSTDTLNRVIATVGAILGIELLIHIMAFLLLVIALPALYVQMEWDDFLTLGFLQLSGFALLHEISVRGLLRLLARRAELSYADWRAEVGI